MAGECTEYLASFLDRAQAAGLGARKPGANWVPLAPLARGSHVSLSVARDQIQVNLNNEDDGRSKFDRLFADRARIETEVGEGLTWEKKDGRQKTAVRATLNRGYEDRDDWARQHEWAIDMMQKFTASFGARLA